MISITSQWLGEATVDEVHAEIPISVTWSSDDPLILQCIFDGTKWDIGRDLILEGLTSESWTGEGDVRVIASRAVLGIKLNTDEGRAYVQMPKHHMQGFLGRVYDIVPLGAEVLDVDGAIGRILEGA